MSWWFLKWRRNEFQRGVLASTWIGNGNRRVIDILIYTCMYIYIYIYTYIYICVCVCVCILEVEEV